jgi:hypothetical protein
MMVLTYRYRIKDATAGKYLDARAREVISDLEAYFRAKRRISTADADVRAEGRAGAAAGGQGQIKSGRGRRRRAAAGDDAP